MYALVDCNNFYVSCERVFNPALNGKPVVVLSNNDGCIISRSQEAKDIGLKMAEPAFKRIEFIERNKVQVFSSNYALYGDMSQRVMNLLMSFSPSVEIYSIDECFIGLCGFEMVNHREYIADIKKVVEKCTGIPISIGVGETKVLSKIANKIAKKNKELNNIYILDSARETGCALRNTPVGDIWGIGRNYSRLLIKNNINTAYDLTKADNNWIRKNLSVVGLRIKEELCGTSCIPIEDVMPDKKVICTSRSFGKKTENIEYLKEAVSTYATRCSEKLRRQKSIANLITVFIHTDYFNENDRQYSKSQTLNLEVPTNSQMELVKNSLNALGLIYRKGYKYKKAGVMVSGIVSETNIQSNLFYKLDNDKHKRLMNIIDKVNSKYGRDTLKLAIQGDGKEWRLRQEKLSKQFTTKWEHILNVKA